MERSLTIRFSHIDGASIVFYPRYFEMVGELFPELPFADVPFAMQTDFYRPNYLADEVQITFENKESRLKPLPQVENDWRFVGRMNGKEHFSIKSLPFDEVLDASAHRPDKPAFQSEAMLLAPWTTDCTGYLQVSRFYELLNAAVEQWFPRALDMSFHELHTERGGGIPTVVMRTRCRELPRAGEEIRIWIRPTEIGTKSLQYTCWLVRNDECLLENEQTIVFIERDGRRFQTIPIPDKVRTRLQEQYVAP
jgi:4-hydroxybenzoyl-CoA thioesterase